MPQNRQDLRRHRTGKQRTSALEQAEETQPPALLRPLSRRTSIRGNEMPDEFQTPLSRTAESRLAVHDGFSCLQSQAPDRTTAARSSSSIGLENVVLQRGHCVKKRENGSEKPKIIHITSSASIQKDFPKVSGDRERIFAEVPEALIAPPNFSSLSCLAACSVRELGRLGTSPSAPRHPRHPLAAACLPEEQTVCNPHPTCKRTGASFRHSSSFPRVA